DHGIGAMLSEWQRYGSELKSGFSEAERLARGGKLNALENSAIRVLSPFRPERIFCAASNFIEHANEMGTVLAAKADSEPYIFMKSESSVIGPEERVLIPASSEKVDWEVELAAVIGKGGRNISSAAALGHIAAYTIFNDVSARDQSRRTDFPFKNDWFRGKSYDTFGPLGPWIVPSSFFPDPQNVDMKLDVSGQLMQDGSTKEMIFTV